MINFEGGLIMLRLLLFSSTLVFIFNTNNVYSQQVTAKAIERGVQVARGLSQSSSAIRSMGGSPHVIIQSQRARQIVDLARTSRILGMSALASQFDNARTNEAKFAQFEQILQRMQYSGDQQLMAQSHAFIFNVEDQVRSLQGQQNLSRNKIEDALKSGLTLHTSPSVHNTAPVMMTRRQLEPHSQQIKATTDAMQAKGFVNRANRLRELLSHLLTNNNLYLLGEKASECVTHWSNIDATRNLADVLLVVDRDTKTYLHASTQMLQKMQSIFVERLEEVVQRLTRLISPPCKTLSERLHHQA